MKISNYLVKPSTKISLSKFSTKDTSGIKSKEDAKEFLEKNIEKMIELQDKLYASDKYSLLLVFQAMDAAGKDSIIKHVMSGLNPQGTQVYSCLLYTSPSPRDRTRSRMPSSA